MRLLLFGEEHGHPLCHRLQKDLYEAWLRRTFDDEGDGGGRPSTASVAISLEMLSTERQAAADEYVQLAREEEGAEGAKRQQQYHREAEALFAGEWANWEDYAPLVRAARRYKQPIVAANAPRRLTSIVARGGEPALRRTFSSSLPLLPLVVVERRRTTPPQQQRGHRQEGAETSSIGRCWRHCPPPSVCRDRGQGGAHLRPELRAASRFRRRRHRQGAGERRGGRSEGAHASGADALGRDHGPPHRPATRWCRRTGFDEWQHPT